MYDHGDRMVETVHGTGAGTYRWYYQYDASGQRVRKVRETSSGNRDRETVYVGNWERYREYTGAGSTVDEEQESLHLSDDRRRFALLEIQVVTGGSSVSNFVERYQLGDHLGTSVLELTASENVLTYEEYYPYGTVSYTAETTSNPGWSRKRYRFTAMERDEETGLQYHHHRYYMPWLGRWTRPDPAGVAAGTNRYAYVAGNPVKRWDASGLVPPTEERVVARAIDRSIKKALATPSERAVSEAEFRDVSDRWVAQSQDLEEYAFSAPVETLYAELATIERGAPDYLDSLSSTQADTVFEARSEIGFALRVREAEHELRDAGLDPREVRLTLEGAVERFAERFSELSVHGRGEFNTHIISLQTQHGQFFGFLDDDKSLGWFEGWEGQAKDPPGKGTPEAHIHTHWLIPPGGVTTAYKATVSGPDETTFSRVLEPRGERMFVVNPDGTTSEIVRTPSGPVAPTPFLYAPSVSP